MIRATRRSGRRKSSMVISAGWPSAALAAAFPAAFPWFGSVRYWQGQIISLQEQLAQLQDL